MQIVTVAEGCLLPQPNKALQATPPYVGKMRTARYDSCVESSYKGHGARLSLGVVGLLRLQQHAIHGILSPVGYVFCSMWEEMLVADLDLTTIRCVVFDFGFTLSSDLYFNVAPPECPMWQSIIQRHIFGEPSVVIPWMQGTLTLTDIATILARHIRLPVPLIRSTLERGCENLTFNQAVWEFACAQRGQGRKTALVTANMDVFTSIVVPSHRLHTIFDLILNTADYGELRKDILWQLAFETFGNGIGYGNSLLIEDGPQEPALFRAHGGYAYQYYNDPEFRTWLTSIGWQA